MKKIVAIMLSLVCAVALFSACSKKTPSPSSSSSSASSVASSSQAGSVPVFERKNLTTEQAADENKKIKASSVNLVQFENVSSGAEIAVIRTTVGEIRVVLYRDKAPKAVENFVTHAKEGYYNGMSFYTVMNNFLIQTGNPADKEGESIYKDADGEPAMFEDEFSLDLWNFRGALVMNNKGVNRPNTNASEFFIVQANYVGDEWITAMEEINYPAAVIEKYQEVGGIPGFDWRNTVFGMVIGTGMDVVDEIASAETDAVGTPAVPIVIEGVTIEKM